MKLIGPDSKERKLVQEFKRVRKSHKNLEEGINGKIITTRGNEAMSP